MADGFPTFAFKDGELQISEARTRWFLTGWPNLKAEVSERGAPRREARPDFRIFKPRDGEPNTAAAQAAGDAQQAVQKREAFEAFRRTFPERVVAVVERFQSHQWNLVDLISKREREALDLAQGNPALFFCLGNNDVFRDQRHLLRTPAYLAMWLLPEKQRSIAEWLGFPATEAMAACLRKVPAESITTWGGRLFRQSVVASPDVLRALGHVPVLNRSVLQIASMWRLFEVATPRLLLEVSRVEEDKFYPHVAERLMDAVRLFVEVRRDRHPPRITSIKRIEEFHTEMVREYQQLREARKERARLERVRREEARMEQLRQERARREEALARARQQRARRLEAERARARQAEEARRGGQQLQGMAGAVQQAMRAQLLETLEKTTAKPIKFPPPPVPGTEDIIPITTADDLLAEAELMRNCLETYIDRVRTGDCYIYRLLKPERAVFSLVHSGSGWQLAEIEKAGNRSVKQTTVAVVRHWLDRRSLAI
jgi:hypothetical protein